ncbi:MAG: DUF1566 domain-containing protein [Alphaproteobacteria bacterium]
MPPRRNLLLVLAIAGASLVGATGAQAAFTPESCLAKKAKAWGYLRKCQRGEQAKAIQSKPADPAKCQAKFDASLVKLDAQAAAASVACRYRDNGDSTVTDFKTGLMWERKNPVTVTQVVTWAVAMTDFLGSCNGASSDGTSLGPGCSVYRDWRVPNLLELQTIVDLSTPGCRAGLGGACIDPVFEPTVRDFYWSSSPGPDPNSAWGVYFGFANLSGSSSNKTTYRYVRAVRSGL